jgi:hypothetical protein
MSHASRLVALACVLLALTPVLFAQSDNASISGVVKDPSGAMIPSARIVLTDERTTFERRTTTNESGYFVFTPVPPGFYTISAEAAGFKSVRQTQNEIHPAMAAAINLTLEVGVVTEAVSVTAQVGSVLPDSGSLSGLVEKEVVENMALSGRNALYAALLVPGVSGDILNTMNFGTSGANGTSINSANPRTAEVSYDGASAYRTRSGGYTVGSVDADAVQEVQVLTSAYSAEYGRSSGGQIRVVTKGGGQVFHGNLFECVQNDAFNANTWDRNRNSNPTVNSIPPAMRFNQFGYNVSGPVFIPKTWNTARNKLFFYFGQEYARYRTPASSSMTVPSAAMRQGDFSQLLVPNNPFARAGLAIKDPLNGVPFAGNVIPAARLSRNGIGLLKEYPETQGNFQSGFNWTGYSTNSQNQVKDTISLDYNPHEKHLFRFRSQYTSNDQYMPYYAAGDRTPVMRYWRGATGSLNYVWTVSPTMVNELLVAVSKDNTKNDVNYAVSADRTLYGVNYAYIFPSTKAYNNKIADVAMELFTTLSATKYPAKSTGPIYKISDTLTRISGKHIFKAGFFFDRSGENDYDQTTGGITGGTSNQNGAFTFTATRSGAPSTGSAVANAALGLFDIYSEYGTKAYTPYRSMMYEWFAQDGWKITSRLRLEIGVRHTITMPNYSLWNNIIAFDAALYDPGKRVVQDRSTGYIVSGQDFNGMVLPGSGWPASAKGRFPLSSTSQYDSLFRNYPRGYADNHSNFQPRFGVAYQLGNGQVIRAGGGRFMLRPYVSDSVFLGGQPPFQPMASIVNGNVDSPGGSGTQNRYPAGMYTIDRKYPIPESYNWNITYSRRMWWKTRLEVSYVGTRGLHTIGYRNINQLQPNTTYSNPGANPNYLRPYGGYYTIMYEDPNGRSKYKSFQLAWNRRFASGFSFGLAYTRMAAYDDGSYRGSGDNLPNAYDRRAVWGPSDYNRPHVVVIHYLYEIPFLKNNKALVGKLLGGWTLSGVSQFQSGARASIVTTDDFAGVGPGSGSQYWVMTGDPILARGEQKFSTSNADANYWFRVTNPDGSAMFKAPTNGAYAAKYNRNVVAQPGFQNWNVAGMKNFRATERQRIQFRAEAYNWLNHPNWSGSSVNPRSANFGKVQSKSSSRVLQLSLRYTF